MTHGGAIFAIAQERGWHWQEVLDFSANINPLGPAPGVRKAIIDALDEIVHYPDRFSSRLRRALAEDWDIDPERILLGNGATELIHFVARIWPANPILITPVFSEFHRAYPNARLLKHGDDWPDEEFVVVTNPMNPTGAAAEIPDRSGDTLIDESFIDFTDLPTRIHSHNIVLRSLTKFHALPGLRIGALVGPGDFVRYLKARREPWQVNVLAEAAALAALRDKDHQRRTREYVAAERQRVWDLFESTPGVHLHPTHTNYYFASLDYQAGALADYLLASKILLRKCTGWPGVNGEAVRFAIRTREENDRLVSLWRAFRCD
ncbi:MAG TPA: aminotransferase class I/II-fold pyridoxal phosphate-dependent enzyme [Bryobacteraceae bacterium]|nr:aminotransferase class I/II-fold pyridoxal phosphate-dependent enzyme [Bryobacteraceae bacterium]